MSNNGTYKLNGQIGEINGNASNGTLTIEGGFFTNMGFTLANVVTSSISSVGLNFAIGGGNVNDNGGSEVTARGIVWSNTTNPTLTTNELGHTSMV